MPEATANHKLKWVEWLLRLVPVVSAVTAVIALLLALAARKKEITCTYLGASKLVSIDPGGIHPDVRMEFRGTPITSLYKLSFRIKNTGTAAVKKEDVREPLALRFASTSRLLNSTVERTFPTRFPFSTLLSPDGQSVVLDFPLLNSGDDADVAVYLYNSEPSIPVFEGRVVDVKQFLTTDNQRAESARLPILHNFAVRRILYWVLVPLYGLLSAFAVFGAGAVALSYFRYLPWKRKWKPQYDALLKEWQSKLDAASNAEQSEQQMLPEVLPVSGTEGSHEAELARLHAHRVAVIAGWVPLNVLSESGIPPHPHPAAETFASMIGITLILIGLSGLLAVTAYLSHWGLGS